MDSSKTLLRALLALGALALGAGCAAHASDAVPDLLWPMSIRPAVSSNFCEYREGHLHAGIDIRTFGEEGVPCRSSGPGYVSRVRASADGYGKALYVQLETGETLVYAHLSEFTPELESTVREEQKRRLSYRVDMRFPPSRFPVERGDVVGYSGMTGTSAPHLHFEVRNTREHPLDPFSNGFTLPDELAPVFKAVRLLPLDTGARIDGICFPAELGAREMGAGRYVVDDTLALSGKVGVSVRVYDRLNNASGRLAPHTIEMAVDGGTVSSISFDRFSFNNTGQVDFVYEIERVRSIKEYYFLLFPRVGETLWNREFTGGGAITSVTSPPGPHRAVITARDRSGNASSLEIVFRNGSEVSASPRGVASGELDGLYFYDNFMAAASAGSAEVSTAAALGGVPRPVSVPGGTLLVAGARRGEERSIRYADLDVEIGVGQRTLYTDQIFYATTWLGDGGPIGDRELERRAGPVRIGPYAMSLRADMEIRFTDVDSDSTTAIYRLEEKKREWVYYPSQRDGTTISTTALRPGIYAVLRDRRAPSLGSPAVNKRLSYATRKPVWELVVSMDDTGSGIDDERSAIYVGGIRQIARWDFVSKKMFVELRDPNIMGRQAVSVVAYDQIGNRSKRDAELVIPSR